MMDALKQCAGDFFGAASKKLVSWYSQLTTCSFHELPEDMRMNKKVTMAAARLGSCVYVKR